MFFKIVSVFFNVFCCKMVLYESAFNNEYPGVNICQSGNLQDLNLHNPETRRKDINNLILNNCTHLQGSLYIRGLRGMRNENILLDSIKEIDGHLIIEGNDVKLISLKNLVVIRGYVAKSHTLTNMQEKVNISLQVTGNLYLKSLNFVHLRSIANHDVLFDNNPQLRYLPHKIKWDELFSKPKIQKVYSNDKATDIASRDVCSSECYQWSTSNTTFCWGPMKNQCQIKTLCEKMAEDCETCLYSNGREINCCDQLCTGGCHKFGPENCMACKQMLDGKKCVETCPSRFTGGIAGTKKNQAFKYYSGSFCSTKCPDTMLPEESACVHHCSEGYFKNATNHCVRCYGDNCQKENIPCDLMKLISGEERDFILSKKVLVQLTNCTKIRGYIIINKHTFNSNNVTVQMLYDHLSNLEELEGGFGYYVDDHLTNLTFLAKLRTFREANLHAYVQGSASYNKFMISSTKLQFLGLKSLKNVTGQFFIGLNSDLCYVDLPWREIINGNFKVIPKKCENEKCDTECNNKGCWYSGNKWCFQCRNFDVNGQCVSNCASVKGYFLSSVKNHTSPTCGKCDEECAKTCNGTLPSQCIGGCVHREENGVCVRKCSFMSYEESGTNKCLPCSIDCTSLDGSALCTGPSNIPGPGGCNKCRHILISRSSGTVPIETIQRCVSVCPKRTYARATNNDAITKFFPSIGYVCEPCNRLCEKCTGRRQHQDDCLKCDGFWNKDMCQSSCSKDTSYGFKLINSSRVCLRCHNACSKGCSGPTASHCNMCRNRKVYINETNFHCQKSCPPEKNVEERDSSTGEIVCRTVWESASKLEEIKRTKTTIAVVLVMLLLVIVIVVLIVVFLRKKANKERLEAELKARYSNLTEPNSKDENAFSKPPNMGRLVIISMEDLEFEDQTRPLGFGAFGYVYKGKWKIPKEDNMVIKKSSGDFFLPVAIKVIKTIGSSEHEAIMQEAKIMSSVSHKHCLRFIGICLSQEKPCLVTAYVKEGSLDKFLVRNRNKITSLIMLRWAEQIADGMLYLTKRGIIHRDLAARNVLVSGLQCVQITDFGLSKMLENSKEKEIVIKSGKVPIRWLAIETLLEGKYSYETDVWAYGVTLWEIFTFGKVPYEDQATLDISEFVLKGGRLSQPDICSLDVYIVLVNCWLESPNLRPDFENLMTTFMKYCKNPGRYLSIEGDPFEIPSPSNIEMTNFNNPYADQFNFIPGTTETMLPLLNNRDSVDGVSGDFAAGHESLQHGEDESRNLLQSSDAEDLPTRTSNRTSNLFKRLHEKTQPNNASNVTPNQSRLVPLASVEEPNLRQSLMDDDPRYVADPTDKQIKLRQNPNNLRIQTPDNSRFHSSPIMGNNAAQKYNLPPAPIAPNLNDDGYLEPTFSPNASQISSILSTDGDDYLEPVSMKQKTSIDEDTDEYLTPSYNNTPRESLPSANVNNNPNRLPISGRASSKLPSMTEERSPSNLYFPQNLVDDEYLEPEPKASLIK